MSSKRTNIINKRERVKFIFPRFDVDSPRNTIVTFAKTGLVEEMFLKNRGKRVATPLLKRSLIKQHRRTKSYSLNKLQIASDNIKTKREIAYCGGKLVKARVLTNGLPFVVKDGVAFLNIVPCLNFNDPEFKVVMIGENTYELIDYKGRGLEKMPRWNSSNDIAKVASEATSKASSETLEIMKSSYFVKDGKLLIKYYNGDEDEIIKEIETASIKVPQKLTLNLK